MNEYALQERRKKKKKESEKAKVEKTLFFSLHSQNGYSSIFKYEANRKRFKLWNCKHGACLYFLGYSKACGQRQIVRFLYSIRVM